MEGITQHYSIEQRLKEEQKPSSSILTEVTNATVQPSTSHWYSLMIYCSPCNGCRFYSLILGVKEGEMNCQTESENWDCTVQRQCVWLCVWVHVCVRGNHACPAEFLWWHGKWWCNSIQSKSFFTHSLSPTLCFSHIHDFALRPPWVSEYYSRVSVWVTVAVFELSGWTHTHRRVYGASILFPFA